MLRSDGSFLEAEGAIIVEHAYNQLASVEKIFADTGWSSIQPIRDYGENPRCLVATKFRGTSMKALIQRVSKASVTIDGKMYGSIERGILIFLGIKVNDTAEDAR